MRWLRGSLVVAYPFAIFFGLRWLEPRAVALAIGAMLVLRVMLRSRNPQGGSDFAAEPLNAKRPTRSELGRLLWPVLLVGAVLGFTLVLNEGRILLFVPAGVNVALLVAFGRTLRHGPPMIETFARLQHPDLTPEKIRHCRTFTGVWCVFFSANAAVCVALALYGDLALWTLYTGLLSYGFIGLLLAAEFVVRSWKFGRNDGGVVDRVLRWNHSKVRRSG
ncbi:MAG: hypothetical protein JRG80_14905 [Deltaproteobacteria bacterium]|nr:hypothetical protein [Deltaproteobacteria bacterium]MBW2400549.1 hypothetical protein [Deltaproteobacteria bacterium]MBW2665683.1 hypothetical protein [Deltaproteobacteria bacterium]